MAYIENRKFTRSTGKQYEVIGTESIGWKAHEAIDSIKSLETGKIVKKKRLETLKFISG